MRRKKIFLPLSVITLFFGIFVLLNSQFTPTGAFIGGAETSISSFVGLFSLVVSGVSYIFSVEEAEEEEKTFV
jgi:hypothetical protein